MQRTILLPMACCRISANEKQTARPTNPYSQKKFHFVAGCFMALVFAFLSFAATASVRYVKEGASGSGNSWASASGDLQAMINASNAGDEVWVAKGVYTPGTARTASFVMKNGVAIYGGLAGTEGSGYDMADRDFIENETILNGEIGAPGIADNIYHIIFNDQNGLDASAILDGFTIRLGTANDLNTSGSVHINGGGIYNKNASPTISNCFFLQNSAEYGGAIYNYQSAPEVKNCYFKSNVAHLAGACLFNIGADADPLVTNCVFKSNTSWQGGGFYNLSGCSPTITNCTFDGNIGWYGGASIHNYAAHPVVTNCIIWGNSGSSIFNEVGSSTSVSYSIVQGNYGGTGNLYVNPLFKSSTDLHLQPGSPAIEAGTTSGAPPNDLEGKPRPYDGDCNGIAKVDMGAYEFHPLQANCQPQTVQLNASGTANLNVALLDDNSTGCGPLGFDVQGASMLSFSCSDIGPATYQLTVEDAFGETATCNATVTVEGNVYACPLGETLDFDGTDDYVTITNDVNFATNSDYTIEGWFKSSTSGKLQTILDGYIENTVKSYLHIEIQLNGKLRYLHRVPANNTGPLDIFSTTTVNTGDWVHFAAVRGEDGKMRLYINGELEKESAVTVPDIPGNFKVDFGRNHNIDRFFNGTLDEIRFWDYARCEAEIVAQMNCELDGGEQGMYAYYKFNKGFADVYNVGVDDLPDDSGNEHSGTLIEFALDGTSSNWTAPGAVPVGPVCTPAPNLTCYRDLDEDGYGNAGVSSAVSPCGCAPGFILDNTDCDDADPGTNPSAALTITCPSSVSVDSDAGDCSAVVTYDAVFSSDNCANPVIGQTNGQPSGAAFPVGTTINVFVVTDDLSNSATCSFNVTVTDNEAPDVSYCPESISSCWESFDIENLGEPTATDNCGIASASGALFDPNDDFEPGTTTTVTYSFSDEAGNTSDCIFTVEIFPRPQPSISATNVPFGCQGLTVLTADPSGLDYNWSNNSDDRSILVAQGGNYTVTVTDGNDCSNTAAMTVAGDPITQSVILSAYTLLAKKDVHAKGAEINGGVGVIESNKKAKLHGATTVAGFVKAPDIDLNGGSTINGSPYVPASPPLGSAVPLPVFQYNGLTNNASPDLKVEDNQTGTIDGNLGDPFIYEKIEVKKNATLIIRNFPAIYAKEIKTKEGATIHFEGNTTVLVQNKVDIAKNNFVGPVGDFTIQFYAEDHIEVDEGSSFAASAYSLKKIHAKKAKAGNKTYMTGQFISGDKIDSDEYVIWEAAAGCGLPLAPGAQSYIVQEDLISLNATMEAEEVGLFWVNNTGYKNDRFVVERSENGVDFAPIFEVDNQSTEAKPKLYRDSDGSPLSGENYYRVKVRFDDGSWAYSQIRRVVNHLTAGELHLYPNPVSSLLSVYDETLSGKPARILLFDSMGHILFEEDYEELPHAPLTFDVSMFRSGQYRFYIKAEGKREVTKKFVVDR